MTLVAQVLWGALFSVPFGFSFHALRLSTLVLGLIGILATYGLLREARASRKTAFIGAVVIATNPIYTDLSNTFMTDVPFFAFALLSIYLYARGLRTGSRTEIATGTVIACIATLTRQVGIMLPMAFAVACIVKNGFRLRMIALALVPVILILGILFGYQKWLTASHNMPLYYGIQKESIPYLFHSGGWQITVAVADFAKKASAYLGLFLLPWLLLTLPWKSEGESAKKYLLGWIPSIAFFLLLMGNLAYSHDWMPLKTERGNILMDFRLGPVPLFDVWLLQIPYIENAPKWIWQIVTLAGVAGAALLFRHVLVSLSHVFRRTKAEAFSPRWLTVLLLATCVLYAMPVLLISKTGYFDRYFLPLMPLMMPLALLTGSVKTSRVSMVLALVILAVFAGFSVAGTHDYFAWNRARWKAYLNLIQVDKIPSRKVNGGYECNGWFSYQEREDWQEFIDDTYVITLGPVGGYQVIRQYPVRSWLPYGQEEILVLRRIE